MYFRRVSLACAIALLLFPCTSCSVEQLDANGDGFVTKGELLSAAIDAMCDDQGNVDSPDDEPPVDETPDDETPDDETPADEVPADEPLDGTGN
jgi:hypothetical protein